ncbi:P-II family nitrogen regulator [candidate division TA06 bacterium]|uniref:P-II family nitrogen regulator n=1 Tax=candidate division TA06 bacterium TaxID=2250710 RepID=A0A523UMV2_UNCT6|nr:MAG: P-II family nitrogen regulator [candidate division TA06 bacterium]
MKEIKAYVRRFIVEDVIRALRKAGAHRLAAIDVEGLADELVGEEKEISSELGSTYTPMVKLELICDKKDVERFVNEIRKVACTGRKGDGIIAVSSLDDVRGIRTGKRTC